MTFPVDGYLRQNTGQIILDTGKLFPYNRDMMNIRRREMAKIKTKIARKLKVGQATLIEKELFVNGEYDDSFCYVEIGGHRIGGYTSIEDALRHKGEWCEE
jgi:hypothetical protein